MLPFYNPRPVPFTGEGARENATWNATVTILDETATAGMVTYQGLRDIACFVYPEVRASQVPDYDTARYFTDRIMLSRMVPNVRSGLFAEVTTTGGERYVVVVLDKTQDSDQKHTTLLVRRRLDRE